MENRIRGYLERLFTKPAIIQKGFLYPETTPNEVVEADKNLLIRRLVEVHGLTDVSDQTLPFTTLQKGWETFVSFHNMPVLLGGRTQTGLYAIGHSRDPEVMKTLANFFSDEEVV